MYKYESSSFMDFIGFKSEIRPIGSSRVRREHEERAGRDPLLKTPAIRDI